VSAPDWRREDATPQKGAERERVSEGEWESDAKLRGRVVPVSVLRRESVCENKRVKRNAKGAGWSLGPC